jgi:hypothetical protein
VFRQNSVRPVFSMTSSSCGRSDSKVKSFFQLVHTLSEFRADLSFDRSPRRRMFRLPFKIKRAGRRGDLALDFGQVDWIYRIHDARRRGVFGRGVDQTGRRCQLSISGGFLNQRRTGVQLAGRAESRISGGRRQAKNLAAAGIQLVLQG